MGTLPAVNEGDNVPDVGELQAREGTAPAVTIQGPVWVRQLPIPRGSARAWTITDAESVCVAKADPARARVMLRTKDAAVWVAFSKAEADVGSGAYFPTTVTPVDIYYNGEIWVRAATTTPTLVSALAEYVAL